MLWTYNHYQCCSDKQGKTKAKLWEPPFLFGGVWFETRQDFLDKLMYGHSLEWEGLKKPYYLSLQVGCRKVTNSIHLVVD